MADLSIVSPNVPYVAVEASDVTAPRVDPPVAWAVLVPPPSMAVNGTVVVQ